MDRQIDSGVLICLLKSLRGIKKRKKEKRLSHLTTKYRSISENNTALLDTILGKNHTPGFLTARPTMNQK